MATYQLAQVKSGGGGSPFLQPALPTPLTNVGYPNLAQTENVVHAGTLINNVTLPTGATGQYVGRLADSTIWSVATTSLGASVDSWFIFDMCWYDSVNDRLYVFGLNTGTHPDTVYTSYITLETGVVTNVGSDQLSTQPLDATAQYSGHVTRPFIDSGNFTLQTKGHVIVIDENTGTEVSNDVLPTVTTGMGTYTTDDGTATLQRITVTTGYTNATVINADRVVNIVPMLKGQAVSNKASSILTALRWGDHVVMYMATTDISFFQAYPLAEFDDWVKEMAALGGFE